MTQFSTVMPKDYRHAEFFSTAARPLSPFMWLFALIAIGAFSALIYYLDRYEKVTGVDKDITLPELSLGKDIPPVSVAKSQPNKNEDGESRFDFYKLLPKLQINVPDEQVEIRHSEITTEKPEQQPAVTLDNPQDIKPKHILPEAVIAKRNPPIKPEFKYILQAGSFKDYREADKLKAGLALMGIEANIERVVLNRSDIWHRVRVGPIPNEREMVRIRSLLRSQNIEPVMLKVKT